MWREESGLEDTTVITCCQQIQADRADAAALCSRHVNTKGARSLFNTLLDAESFFSSWALSSLLPPINTSGSSINLVSTA